MSDGEKEKDNDKKVNADEAENDKCDFFSTPELTTPPYVDEVDLKNELQYIEEDISLDIKSYHRKNKEWFKTMRDNLEINVPTQLLVESSRKTITDLFVRFERHRVRYLYILRKYTEILQEKEERLQKQQKWLAIAGLTFAVAIIFIAPFITELYKWLGILK